MSILVDSPARPSDQRASVAVDPSSADDEGLVILTIGWTGSSVLTGLLKAGGYWTGATVKKSDYDTYENEELVRLNRRLLAEAGIGESYAQSVEADWPVRIEELSNRTDPAEFRAFVDLCRGSGPWVWKDPRLWVTMPFWARLLPERGVKYILLTREPLQAWISCNMRRQVQSYGYMKRYSDAIESLSARFLDASNAPWLRVVYEDLLLRPEAELARLSAFCGRALTIEHLRSIYNGALYRRNRRFKDFVIASLVYAKNFGERLR